jgi:hypothetical protein
MSRRILSTAGPANASPIGLARLGPRSQETRPSARIIGPTLVKKPTRTLIDLQEARRLPRRYVTVAAHLPDGLALLSEQELREQFNLYDLDSKALGDWWIDSLASAVLVVPSTIIGEESNYLLNPAHRDFQKIAIEPPALFHFDRRLFGQ